MDPPNKKRRGEWTEAQLKAALQAVNNKLMSQRAAAARYSIPRRTLRNHLQSGSTTKITGRAAILTKSQEKDLCKRVIRLAQVGMPLTPKIVRKQAYEFCKANNIPNSFSDKKNIAGKKWLKNFVRRNPEISLRKAQLLNPARAQKLNKPIVLKHFKAIKNIYDELDISKHPERLYNMDEKGCRLTLHHQQKVFSAKGVKRVHFVAQEHAENVTIAMCVNATGNTVPPMILFKGKRLRPEFCDNLPPGSLVKMAPKGSMTTELFVEFIHHLGQFKSPGKCLLIFDGASSHLDARIVDAADTYDIVLYCLPSNTTHELQPLDKSVNKSYEHFWDEEVLLHAYQNPERKLTKTRFTKIFTKVWSKCMTKQNIISGFRATGLFPYDANAIPEEAYAPSALTQLPNPCELSTSDISVPRVSNLRSVVESLRPDSSSDTNASDCEEVSSPSVITDHLVYDLRENEIIEKQNPQYPSPNCRKLVDYSSSSEFSSVDDSVNQKQLQGQTLLNKNDRNADFCSPIPSTSRNYLQPCPRLNSLTSDESDEENFDTYLKKIQYRSKPINIYTSSSESDEENVDPNYTNQIPSVKHVLSEDSEDDLPLSKVKKDAGIVPFKSPFHKQIPTPNFATIKNKPRRKALNYVGQIITKDLFDAVKEKKKMNSKKRFMKKPVRDDVKSSGTNISKNFRQNKMKVNEVKRLNESKLSKNKKQKNVSKRDSKESKKAGWYCHGCKMERIADMRKCSECQKWYHEECVGLTTDDKEQFVCPDCN